MDVIKQMMLDTIQRGDNSSGLFMTDYMDPHSPPTGVKVLGGPHNIIYNSALWNDVTNFVQRKAGCLVGHGRYATRGRITVANAHPFQHEHITLVHNGTIHSGLNYAKKGDVDVDVDSHALTVAIAEKGMMRALSEIRGAYAIIAHDSKEGCLYIARNGERPLHVYSTPSRHYIMSEGSFLDVIMQRYSKKITGEHVMYFKPEALIKIDLHDSADYEHTGDIAAVRLEYEAAEKEMREKEAEERRKKYTRNTPHIAWSNGSPKEGKERVTFQKDLKDVAFLVESVEPFGANFKYFCRNTEGVQVTFISDERKPEYIDMIGRARIHSFVYKGNVCGYFVRHRDIVWHITAVLDRIELPPFSKEESEPIGHFLTHNSKRISTDSWAKRIVNEGCNTCAATFSTLDYKNVVLTDDDMLLCKSCAAEFNVGTNTKVH